LTSNALQRLSRPKRRRTTQTPHHDPQTSDLARRRIAHNLTRTVRATTPLEPFEQLRRSNQL